MLVGIGLVLIGVAFAGELLDVFAISRESFRIARSPRARGHRGANDRVAAPHAGPFAAVLVTPNSRLGMRDL